MGDRSLGIWLMVVFGVTGLTAVLLAWLLPAFRPDRALATAGGAVGIGVAVMQGIMLRRSTVRPAKELALDFRAEDRE